MLAINPAVPIYLHAEPIDMRKSFDGLFGIVKADLQRDVRDGGLFMFLNSRCNRIKLMYWDTDGIAIWMKRLPIDNNQVERLMKRIAIGRKNWLFTGSLRAGIRNASLMSLVASALRMELDVSMYLESVITHRVRGTAKFEELLPDRWRAHHPEAVREYREQERRDKADVASLQAAKRRARSQLR
jgi:IS66 Orf2 like protein/Transposase IS66 family